MAGNSKDVNKANLLKKQKKEDKAKTHFTIENLFIFEESNRGIEMCGEIPDQISERGLV